MNVLEFNNYLAASLLGKYLVDFNFNVTSVERPEHSRGKECEDEYMKHMRNDITRGKTCINLDLPKQIEDLKKLINQTDIIVENFGPGVSKKRGFDFESCKKINPKIIYISLPAYMPGDEDNYGTGFWDGNVMASTGVFCDMGLNRQLLGIKASYSSLTLPSSYGSIFGLFVLMCAIRSKKYGEEFIVPLASSLLEALVHNSITFPLDECYMNMRKREILKKNYPITKQELDYLQDPFFRKYTCLDDRPFYLVCPAHVQHQQRAIRVLGIEREVLSVMKPVDVYSEKFNYGLGCGNVHESHAKKIFPFMKQAFLKKTSGEWEILFGEYGVPAIAHKTKEEWLSNNHTIDSGLVTKTPEGCIKVGPLGWLNYSHKVPINFNFQKHKKSLKGIKVLDFTNVIAGPTIGAMFARMGAEVLKVDSPRPFYSPDISVIYGIATNVGKKSLLLDIMDPEGRKILEKMLLDYDILIINCTSECLQRINLTQDYLRKINPNIILVHFDAWSGVNEKGKYRNYVGYDDNVQAGIGIMSRFGGSLEDSEEHAHVGTIDVIAGVACAATAVHSLILKEKFGVINTVRTSLASVGQYVQYPFMFEEPDTIFRGLKCRGENPLYCCYQTQTGWIFVGDSLVHERTDYTFEYMKNKFFDMTTKNAISYCKEKNIKVCLLESMEAIRHKNIVSEYQYYGKTIQFLVNYDHPVGVTTMIAPVATRMEQNIICHSPKYGKDTRQILKKYDLESALLTSAVSCSWSKYYIPYSLPCNICQKKGRKLFTLSCGHKLCFYCMGCAENKCSICGHEHETSIEKLDSILKNWKRGYKQWRRGLNHGSGDIEKLFCPRD